MLQIATGKLFTRPPERINALRGVLHTNLRLYADAPIQTAAGRLLATNAISGLPALVFEMDEHIESQPDGGCGVLVSHTVEPYLSDFGALVSFKLNVVCAPDRDLIVRLTADKRSLSGPAPNSLVSRCFDEGVFCTHQEASALAPFIAELVALERKHFLAAMRAIRTYVTGVYRMGDDLDLAYTLMVASLESLAQEFDGHRARWEDYEDTKRRRIDRSLAGADATTAAKVRAAVLDSEHVKLARRFRAFTLDHITPAFFREEAPGAPFAIARTDLEQALKIAYELRSAYVHRLAELPRQLVLPRTPHELAWTGKNLAPTFTGLMRITRHVIAEFIVRGPKCEREVYDYSLERSGIVQVLMAEQYWIHNVASLSLDSGSERLAAFLNQLATFLVNRSSAVTDIRQVLSRALELMAGASAEQRRPLTALYVLFNKVAPPDDQMEGWRETFQTYASDLALPSVEAAIVHLFSGTPDWPVPEHLAMLLAHAAERVQNKGLHAPKFFEAALWLALAERQRAVGDEAASRMSIAAAVESYPGEERLRSLESGFEASTPIDWRDVLTGRMPTVPNA